MAYRHVRKSPPAEQTESNPNIKVTVRLAVDLTEQEYRWLAALLLAESESKSNHQTAQRTLDKVVKVMNERIDHLNQYGS